MFRRIAEPFIGVAAIIQCRKPVAFQHFEFHVIRRNPAKVADAMHFCFCRLPGRVMKPRKIAELRNPSKRTAYVNAMLP